MTCTASFYLHFMHHGRGSGVFRYAVSEFHSFDFTDGFILPAVPNLGNLVPNRLIIKKKEEQVKEEEG